MPKTQVNCPNCRQPIIAEVTQLFDANVNPQAKQMILSGNYNVVHCQYCGYQGNLTTPIVYHDPEKELLLTYFPPELGLPMNEQERLIGPLVSQAMNNLPPEKRKGYLFRPQTVLTMQGMVERILEADGITKEMIQAQQKRLNLLGRLLESSEDRINDLIQAEDELLDADFFTLLGRLFEAALSGGDSESANKLAALQEKLLNTSTYGKQVKSQSDEFEAAVRSLEKIGKGLTRQKLLDLLIQAPNDTRLSVLVSLTRPGLDYEFFQLLSERIDKVEGEEKARLLTLREKLLDLTRSIDQAVDARLARARQILNQILAAPEIAQAFQNNLTNIDEFFLQVMAEELDKARQSGDLERIDRIRQLDSLLQQISKPSREIELIQTLLSIENETEQQRFLEENRAEITPEFLATLGAVLTQVQENRQNQDLSARLEQLYRAALRLSMTMNLNG